MMLTVSKSCSTVDQELNHIQTKSETVDDDLIIYLQFQGRHI